MAGENIQATSVSALVRRRAGGDADPWHLALVQRDVVWEHIRMRFLLDSLLEGYPIGSLLVCQVTSQSRVIRLDGAQRIVDAANADAWQLLDGQQRINARFSIFTSSARYGRFYLHMTARRDSPQGPVTRRRARDEGLRSIHWQEEPEADERYRNAIAASTFRAGHAWAKRESGGAADAGSLLGAGPTHTVAILNEIDSDFADALDAVETEIAWRRLRRLIQIWRTPSIPVQYLRLGSPEHVLEVFTRLNRAGVQVAGEDLFFAAVKTRWNDAEQVIARVVSRLRPQESSSDSATLLVGRLGTFRTIARLAARAVGQAEFVPLTVNRLSGPRGLAIINGMQTVVIQNRRPSAGWLPFLMR